MTTARGDRVTTCEHGFDGDCMVCDPEPYEPARDPACDGYIGDRDEEVS